jgi:uncharacterized membrane protein
MRIDDNFLRVLGEKLAPGGAAVIVLVHEVTPTRCSPRSPNTAAMYCRHP